MAAIEVEGLVKTYPKGVTALDGLSFSVDEGEVFGLLGPNGAGKSTTVKILVTLSTPDSGRALVAGRDVLMQPDAVRRAIGYVPQNSGVDVNATGRENLMLQGRVQQVPLPELRRRIDELLETFGIGEFADRIVRTYSGGMKRRLDVALGLVHRPQVLFLDEPTAGLDPEARAAMWDELERLAGQEKLTILLTTHYLEEADHLAQRIAIVSRGKVAVEGTPEALKRGFSATPSPSSSRTAAWTTRRGSSRPSARCKKRCRTDGCCGRASSTAARPCRASSRPSRRRASASPR